MSGLLEIAQPGIGTTVQDRGRVGHRHHGMPLSGWLDGPLARAANALLGNPPDEAVLELRGMGTVLRVTAGPVRLALAGRIANAQKVVDKLAGGTHPGFWVAVDAAAKIGSLSIRFGLGWAKSHSFHTGQTPVMKYNRALMQAIMWDRINIAEVVGVQVISLDDAPRGYGEFDAGVPKKFVIDPHKLFSAA